jgi:nitrogen regulatory protein PII
MMQVTAVVKPFRARAVLEALEAVPLVGGTVREVRGYNRQKHRLHRYLGSEFSASFVPKVQITLFLDDAHLPAALKAIVAAARTGAMGDGKILVNRLLGDFVSW